MSLPLQFTVSTSSLGNWKICFNCSTLFITLFFYLFANVETAHTERLVYNKNLTTFKKREITQNCRFDFNSVTVLTLFIRQT